MKLLWSNIKEWRQELVGMLAAIALFFFSPVMFRWIDPTAGTFDIGILQNLCYSTVAVLTFSFLSFIGLKLNWPEVFKYGQENFVVDFQYLNGWQKAKILLLIYFGHLLAFLLMAKI